MAIDKSTSGSTSATLEKQALGLSGETEQASPGENLDLNASKGNGAENTEQTEDKATPGVTEGEMAPEVKAQIEAAVAKATEAIKTEAESKFQSIFDKKQAEASRLSQEQNTRLEQTRQIADMAQKEKAIRARYEDDPDEAEKRVKDMRDTGTREMVLHQREEAQKARDVQGQEAQKGTDAERIGKEFGIDPATLLNDKEITSTEAMENKALRLQNTTLATRIQELEKPAVKINNGAPAASGPDLSSMGSGDKIAYGLQESKKKQGYNTS